ncbi:MAG TPA: Hpt domain-containing protein [Steroidobacteraceae bacterium]|jgi:HPt (histidine-containing phosphotransfer) domain-containing protein|nr:Hpt domain-containing protein [Steroidobacteraceae bacterium]
MTRTPSPGWPEIEGIDAADARARWCGDAALFVKILAQMFERFGAACEPRDEAQPDEIGDGARRMHKLRGAAASLGAKGIYFSAGQLEAAYLAGDLELASHLRARLAEAMCRLREAAKPALRGGSEHAAAAGEGRAGGADAAQSLRRLDELLRRQDLAALTLFKSVSIDLERLLGVTPYRRMQGHIENLRFEQASRDLRAVLG